MSKPLSSREQKVAWLVANPLEWVTFPDPHAEKAIIEGMRAAGLLSPKTKSKNVLDLGPLVGDARAIMNHNKNRRRDLDPRR